MSGSLLPLSVYINPPNDHYCSQTWNIAQMWPGFIVNTHRLGDFRYKFPEEKRGEEPCAATLGLVPLGNCWHPPSLQLVAILIQLLADWQACGGKHLTRTALRRYSVYEMVCPGLPFVGLNACPHLWLRVSPTVRETLHTNPGCVLLI